MDKACHGAQENLARFQRWINFDVVHSPQRLAAITARHAERVEHNFGNPSVIEASRLSTSPIDRLRQAAIDHTQPGHIGL